MMNADRGAGAPGARGFNYRVPPSLSPETDSRYSSRAHMTDISLWITLTELQPHQQCAAIVIRLADQLARWLA